MFEPGDTVDSSEKFRGLGDMEELMLYESRNRNDQSLSFEMRFKTMRLPPNVDVRIEGSTARIRGDQLGIETIWSCSCTKGEGTCTIQNNEGVLACHRGAADTCKADCFLSMDLGGLLGSPQN